MAALEAAHREAAEANKAVHERSMGIHASLDAAQEQQRRLQQQIADIKAAGRSKLAAFGGRAVVELVQASCSCHGGNCSLSRHCWRWFAAE